MSLLLCHQCFAWVEPHGGRCPDCLETLDPAMPDPDLATLRVLIGEIVHPLGEVRVPRRLLPEYGTLYATRNGLYFLPHAAEDVAHLVEGESAGASLLWTVASIVWSPLVFVMPFVKAKELRESRTQVLRPQRLTAADSPRLAELLMENPGVFFVPRRSIRHVVRRRQRWIIDRAQARPLKLTVASDGRHFQERMSDLFAEGSWRSVSASF
ncbi:MAG TPA: hypothetical protein VML55_00660 [Planctomycetaceae bacterium]|nr:hypothetical protein [Planctomycetaceae bacterium]